MKRIIYLCCLLSLAACNTKKPETAQVYPKTPTGMQGIQQSAIKSTVQAGNTGALNPVHGAPGHRCDIAVGAPLNSPPTQKTTPVQPQAVTPPPPIAQPAQNIQTAANTSAKLNPKHGEPNHRCDIAVGAPLDSKASNITAAPQITTQVTPKAAASPMFNAKGQRLNPAHGKPGHKCEIAVGAPLT